MGENQSQSAYEIDENTIIIIWMKGTILVRAKYPYYGYMYFCLYISITPFILVVSHSYVDQVNYLSDENLC